MKFGDKIKINKKYVRQYYYDTNYAGESRVWELEDIVPEREGIFLGARTIFNGRVIRDREYGNEFRPNSHIRVALACYSEKVNPIYVPIE